MNWKLTGNCFSSYHALIIDGTEVGRIFYRRTAGAVEAYVKGETDNPHINIIACESFHCDNSFDTAKEWIENVITILTPDEDLALLYPDLEFTSSLDLMQQRFAGDPT